MCMCKYVSFVCTYDSVHRCLYIYQYRHLIGTDLMPRLPCIYFQCLHTLVKQRKIHKRERQSQVILRYDYPFTQLATTLHRRWNDAKTLKLRRNNVVLTLCASWVSIGCGEYIKTKPWVLNLERDKGQQDTCWEKSPFPFGQLEMGWYHIVTVK